MERSHGRTAHHRYRGMAPSLIFGTKLTGLPVSIIDKQTESSIGLESHCRVGILQTRKVEKDAMKPDLDYMKKLLEAFKSAPEPTTDINRLKDAGLDYEDKQFEFHMDIFRDKGTR